MTEPPNRLFLDPDDEVEPVPRKAVQVVFDWLDAVLRRDFFDAWALMDDNFRLVDAQLWLWANREHAEVAGRDLDRLAAELAADPPEGPWAHQFAAGRRDVYPQMLPPFPASAWGAGTHRRKVGDGLDLIVVLDSRHIQVIPPYSAVDPSISATFLTREVAPGTWSFAGTDHQPPTPGWPPTSGVLEE